MRHIKTLSLMAALSLASAASAQVRTCGFDSPEYHLGSLSGQSAWTLAPANVPPGAATVVASPRHDGNQAARFDQSAYSSEFYADWHPNVALTPTQTSAEVEWDMYIEPGNGFGWIMEVTADNSARLGWLWVDNGNMWYSTYGTHPLLANGFMDYHAWHHMKMTFDWQARTTAFFMDGQQIGSAPWFLSPTRSVGRFELRAVVGNATDIAGIDTITVTPRPTCSADYNANGTVDSQDFYDFLNDFFAARPRADFNADGIVNSRDFFDFLAAFFAGCP